MGFIEFIFVLMIIAPIAVLMFVIFRKLTAEYNAAVKKERDIKSGKYQRDREAAAEAARYAGLKQYRRDNPGYDAYRRKMENKNKKERER